MSYLNYNNPYNFDKDITPPEFDKKFIEENAFHLFTKGAYVQTPIPGVYAIKDNEVLIGVDAKSLYPTEMCNGNIGYDTLYGRIYDTDIVGNIIEFINMMFIQRVKDPKVIKTGYTTFKKNFLMLVTDYCSRNTVKSASDAKEFGAEYYSILFYKIISYKGEFKNIMQPETDEEYSLLMCCLYPILEAMTWLSKANPGYNKTVHDWIFHNPTFEQLYKDKKFYIFDKINNTYTNFYCLSYDQLIEYYFTKFILNPYGTLYYRHYDLKSFEVDNIFRGMASRKKVKDEYLILEAVTVAWNKLNDNNKLAFYNTRDHIDSLIADEIISIVGDSNEKIKKGQLKSLIGISLDIKDTIDYRKQLSGKDTIVLVKEYLEGLASYKNAYQNGEKVNLNTGYGLNGMTSWDWSNSLIANSITCAGKIHGIKCFQQVATKVLANERLSRGL